MIPLFSIFGTASVFRGEERMGLSTLDHELLRAVTVSGSQHLMRGLALKWLIPADWGWASSPLKGTLSFMTHCRIPRKGWLWVSPQGSTGKLRQQEQKEAEALLGPRVRSSCPK